MNIPTFGNALKPGFVFSIPFVIEKLRSIVEIAWLRVFHMLGWEFVFEHLRFGILFFTIHCLENAYAIDYFDIST